jgi:glycosyltransferase involved in cell wall biosynthesis
MRVLEIAKQLHIMGVNFQLTLVGSGPQRSAFEAFVSRQQLDHKIHFTGWQLPSSLKEYYQSAHIILLPSSSEGWPKVLSEAMAHGVVPLASTISSIPQVLQASGAGLAISTDDINAYVQAILKYTQDAVCWKQASLQGIQFASQFTYEQYLASVREIYKKTWDIDFNHG